MTDFESRLRDSLADRAEDAPLAAGPAWRWARVPGSADVVRRSPRSSAAQRCWPPSCSGSPSWTWMAGPPRAPGAPPEARYIVRDLAPDVRPARDSLQEITWRGDPLRGPRHVAAPVCPPPGAARAEPAGSRADHRSAGRDGAGGRVHADERVRRDRQARQRLRTGVDAYRYVWQTTPKVSMGTPSTPTAPGSPTGTTTTGSSRSPLPTRAHQPDRAVGPQRGGRRQRLRGRLRRDWRCGRRKRDPRGVGAALCRYSTAGELEVSRRRRARVEVAAALAALRRCSGGLPGGDALHPDEGLVGHPDPGGDSAYLARYGTQGRGGPARTASIDDSEQERVRELTVESRAAVERLRPPSGVIRPPRSPCAPR